MEQGLFSPRKKSGLLAVLVSGLVLVVYLATLASDLTFEHTGSDGGDLISAAWRLGVPHPPGYPTYTLLGWLFTRFPVGTIAYRINLLSAVCAAGVIFFLFLISSELQPEDDRSLVIPAATSTILAFATLFWSQAVISEVYTLLALFAALLLWLLMRWRNGAANWYLWLVAFFTGLGLGNHLSLIFILPASVILLWSERRRWLRVGVILPLVAFTLLGLSIYAYLPLAASMEPPVNWGYINSLERFWWVVSAKQYQPFVFGLAREDILEHLFSWSGIISSQFGWWGLVIAAIGIAAWWVRDRLFLIFSMVWAVPLLVYAFFYNTSDAYTILLPLIILMALWWGEGARFLILLGQETTARRAKSHSNKPLGAFWRWWPPFIILLLPMASLTTHWKEVDLSKEAAAPTYIAHILESVPADSLVVTRRDKPTFGLWYEVYANQKRSDLAIVNARMLAYLWYRDQIRTQYPDIQVPRPSSKITSDELVRDFINMNILERPVYATDPVDAWEDWFEFIPMGEGPVYRVQMRENGD
jgi:hypothetical protein